LSSCSLEAVAGAGGFCAMAVNGVTMRRVNIMGAILTDRGKIIHASLITPTDYYFNVEISSGDLFRLAGHLFMLFWRELLILLFWHFAQ
jgi:hypothetical protein